jgi:chitinase
MAYDFAGPWTKTAGHHGQLFSDKAGERSGAAGVEYVCSTGFPAAKILLGIPVYGRSFLNATQPGDSFSGNAGQDGAFDYKDLPRQGTKEVVNSRLAVASCVGGDGGFVSYDNPETVKIKAEYCKDNQLGVGLFFIFLNLSKQLILNKGLFYWTGTGDVASGPRSLISAGFKVLHNLR